MSTENVRAVDDRPEAPVDAFAYYLPQFYPIEHNSTWWGEGFTEWVSVLRAHAGWRSPKGSTLTPGELGFYDLRDRSTRTKQGALARESGLAALCVYHYWSAGERLLPDVVDAILDDGEPAFPFFLGWANHNWTLAWQERGDVVTFRQEYDEHTSDKHIEWLLAAMADPRYYQVDGRHVLLVYDPLSVTEHLHVFERWRALARDRGIDLLLLGATRSLPVPDPASVGLDAWVQGTAHVFAEGSRNRRAFESLWPPMRAVRHLKFRDIFWNYPALSRKFEESLRAFPDPTVPLVISGWNNVGRRSRKASSTNSTPDEFRVSLEAAIRRAPVFGSGAGARKLVAINAWNEWGEGMVLEPSTEWGREYLEALKAATD